MNRKDVQRPSNAQPATWSALPSPAEIVARYERISVAEHPLFVAIAHEPLDMSSIWLLMANLRAGISREFVVWLALTIARIDDRRMASLLAKQLDDELGSGDYERIHSTLLDHFVAALAPYRMAGSDQELLSPGNKLLEEAAVPFYAEHPYESIGALMVGEIFANKFDSCLGQQIRRQNQLSEKALTWLTVHETLEAHHAEDSGALAQLVPNSGPPLVAAWRGAEAQWNSLWRFLDRLHALRTELKDGARLS